MAHLDQQGEVLVGGKTGIQAELGIDWFGVGGIVLFKASQTLLQGAQFSLLPSPMRCGFVKAAPRSILSPGAS
jgi:hypothetical protein